MWWTRAKRQPGIRTAYFKTFLASALQVDEIWGFVGCQAKECTDNMKTLIKDAGDAWLWLATDADTKLVPCWHVGGRDGGAAMEFIDDLASPPR